MTVSSSASPNRPMSGSNVDDSSAVSLLCSDLIRHDSSALGELERGVAERVAEELSNMSLEAQVLEQQPRRTNVVTRIAGTDSSAPALLVHIHLDVVPADADTWQIPPMPAKSVTDASGGEVPWT